MKKALEEAKLELILIDNDVIVTSNAGAGISETENGGTNMDNVLGG